MSYGRAADGTRTAKRGGGGLVTALRSLVQYHEVTWIASAITEEDRAVAGETLEETARDGSPHRLHLVAHDRQAYDWYYNVVANPMLWFVQHLLWELPYAPRIDAAFIAPGLRLCRCECELWARSTRGSSERPTLPCSSMATSTWLHAWCVSASRKPR